VPDRLGFVVALVDGDPQTIAVEAEHLGDELPRPRDRFLLEVVAETEVAEHLEEHEVALRATDVVEVVVLAARAHALLHAHRAAVRGDLVTDEVRLERHHAGHREEQRLVERNECGRRNDRVFLVAEVAGERVAQRVRRVECRPR